MKRNYRTGDQTTLALEMDYYNSIDGHYEPLTEADYDTILAHLCPFQRPPAILEVGCGSGAFGVRLQRRLASRVNIGLDVSFKLLGKHPFSPVLGNGQKLPFENESFDLIAASAALHHIHNITATLAEISRCLRSSGRVIFVEPNADHPYRRLVVDGGLLRKYFLQTSDESIYPDDLVKIMHSIGFRELKFRYVTFQNRRPSILGRVQSWVSRSLWHPAFERYIHPWFILTGEK